MFISLQCSPPSEVLNSFKCPRRIVVDCLDLREITIGSFKLELPGQLPTRNKKIKDRLSGALKEDLRHFVTTWRFHESGNVPYEELDYVPVDSALDWLRSRIVSFYVKERLAERTTVHSDRVACGVVDSIHLSLNSYSRLRRYAIDIGHTDELVRRLRECVRIIRVGQNSRSRAKRSDQNPTDDLTIERQETRGGHVTAPVT